MLVFFAISPTVSKRMMEIPKNTQSYFENHAQNEEILPFISSELVAQLP
jgi:hypothetical protein